MTQQRRHSGPVHSRPAVGASAPSVAPSVAAVLNFGGESDPADVLSALLLDRFIDGSQPYAHTQRLDAIRDGATLLPPGVAPVMAATGDGVQACLATGEGWLLHSVRWRASGEVTVTATSPELAKSIVALATESAVPDPEPEDDRVEIGFWHLTVHGPRRRTRSISATPWPEIRRNYSTRVAAAIDQLVDMDGHGLNGRILLVHGAPGTGKTTLLRTLALRWRSWCQVDFVLDPEELFNKPGYLIEVVMGHGDEDGKPWRLLLLEDCDELIRSGAKQTTGQALARLLNLTDGLLGQGRQILVAITTNEDVTRLHPAITRPGRCLAQIEIGPLPYPEAVAWLGRSAGIGRDGATLAQLLALRDGTGPVAVTEPEPEPVSGLYL